MITLEEFIRRLETTTTTATLKLTVQHAASDSLQGIHLIRLIAAFPLDTFFFSLNDCGQCYQSVYISFMIRHPFGFLPGALPCTLSRSPELKERLIAGYFHGLTLKPPVMYNKQHCSKVLQ